MKRKLTVHASTENNINQEQLVEYVIHYTIDDNPQYKVEVISSDSSEDAIEQFYSNHNNEDVTVCWVTEQPVVQTTEYDSPSVEFNYVYSDSLDEMVVSGFFIQDQNESEWKHYSWNDEDCLYYWDEADDDWYDEVPDDAVAKIPNDAIESSSILDDEVSQSYVLSGPEELSPAGFYKFFDAEVDHSIKEHAADILYSWYKAEGEDYMPTDINDILSMCDAATDSVDKNVVLTALNEV